VSQESPSARIVIDRSRCIGTGNCAFYAERTFDLDDENRAVVIDPDGDPAEKQKLAVAQCPTEALSFAPLTSA
jgi:ferredoxin